MRKFCYIFLGIILLTILTACNETNSIKEFDKESDINISNIKENNDENMTKIENANVVVLLNKSMEDIVEQHTQEELKNMYEKNNAFDELIYKAIVDMDNDNITDTIEISFYMKVRYNDAIDKYGFGYEVTPDYYIVKINEQQKKYIINPIKNIQVIQEENMCKLKFDSSYRETSTYYLSYENKEICEEIVEEVYSLDKFILKQTNSSLDDVIMYNIDLDFDGIAEILYYPNKNYQYSTELSVFGIKKDGTFGKIIDECGRKVALLENKTTKEKLYVCYKYRADGLCYLYDEILKFEKTNYGIVLKQLFLETCNQDEEEKYREELKNTLTEEEYDDAIFNSHISKYNAYGKSVTKDEYDRLLIEFNDKYVILNSFEVPN